MKAAVRQIGLLSLLTFLFVAPHLAHKGTNIVTNTYLLAAERFWAGVSPYILPGAGTDADWYKYSPFFSMIMGIFLPLPRVLTAELWALINIVGYWVGVQRWFQFDRTTPKWLWVALIGSAMEIDGSLRYQQINALLIGAVLFALADYRDKKYWRSAVLLTVATNIKVIPLLFAVALLFPLRRDYLKGLLTAAIAVTALPLLWIGPEKLLIWHIEWAQLLLADTTNDLKLLDIRSILTQFGHPELGTILRTAILYGTLIALPLRRVLRSDFKWESWIALGVHGLLLVSPRTESPTFVLAGPTYLLLERASSQAGGFTKWVGRAFWFTGFFLVTWDYNDLWIKALWNPRPYFYLPKVMGSLSLWCGAVFLLAGEDFRRSRRA